MKTRDCVEMYVKNMILNVIQKGLKAHSCKSLGQFFVSYETPICEFVNGKFHLATRKYSVTTSKQQNYLRFFIPKDMLKEVFEINSDKFPFAR